MQVPDMAFDYETTNIEGITGARNTSYRCY